ncbi:hypothetical protein [Bradyrhizobium sp. USDA 10063]
MRRKGAETQDFGCGSAVESILQLLRLLSMQLVDVNTPRVGTVISLRLCRSMLSTSVFAAPPLSSFPDVSRCLVDRQGHVVLNELYSILGALKARIAFAHFCVEIRSF